MPELPEVETIVKELAPHITGRRINDITLFWDGIVPNSSASDFRSRVIGQRINGVGRRGKYILFHLSSNEALVIHLRMTGSVLLNSASSDGRYIRAIIRLDGGTELYFRDPRKLGRMWLEADTPEILDKLGPEPLEAGFTPKVLAERLRGRTAPIKALLLDQTFVAGIGNMYADEALFAAGIHPLRSGGSLSRQEVNRLHHAIRQVLGAAIAHQGASVLNYYRPGGDLGTAHFDFKVAHRGGKPCPSCGTPLQRLSIRNRGSYFCPKCQPES